MVPAPLKRSGKWSAPSSNGVDAPERPGMTTVGSSRISRLARTCSPSICPPRTADTVTARAPRPTARPATAAPLPDRRRRTPSEAPVTSTAPATSPRKTRSVVAASPMVCAVTKYSSSPMNPPRPSITVGSNQPSRIRPLSPRLPAARARSSAPARTPAPSWNGRRSRISQPKMTPSPAAIRTSGASATARPMPSRTRVSRPLPKGPTEMPMKRVMPRNEPRPTSPRPMISLDCISLCFPAVRRLEL